MTKIECEVGIIGAGVAGLSAAAVLTGAGVKTICLEATDRAGGRIWTVHDPLAALPVELGAEFVHGRSPALFELIRANSLSVFEHTVKAAYMDRGRCAKQGDVGEDADRVMKHLARSRRRSDESFDDYLRRSRHSSDVKKWARVHIEGFNAARSDVISTGSLIREAAAAGEIEGDRVFRILEGYDSIPLALLRSIRKDVSAIRLSSIAERVQWRPGDVAVTFRSTISGEPGILRCRRLVITVPLGVLQAEPGAMGAIRFEPEPVRNLEAARSLKFGHVYRITLRFDEAFWEGWPEFNRVGFFVSQDRHFFTWWSAQPLSAPLLTGWMAGAAADSVRHGGTFNIAQQSIASLHRILGRRIPAPQAFYFHDWECAPFFRGAYSYVPAGLAGARESLAKPVRQTLYFAGEASAVDGHASTVHGALRAGQKAASAILNSGEPA